MQRNRKCPSHFMGVISFVVNIVMYFRVFVTISESCVILSTNKNNGRAFSQSETFFQSTLSLRIIVYFFFQCWIFLRLKIIQIGKMINHEIVHMYIGVDVANKVARGIRPFVLTRFVLQNDEMWCISNCRNVFDVKTTSKDFFEFQNHVLDRKFLFNKK